MKTTLPWQRLDLVFDRRGPCWIWWTASLKTSRLSREWIFAATPLFMGVAAIKFKNGDMEAMGKNLGGAVCLFLVPKIIEVILAWAAQ